MTVPHTPADGSAPCDSAAALGVKQAGAAPPAFGAACGPRPEEPELVEGTDEYRQHLPVSAIHPHDENTKDDWVPR